jgi:hypothetical protein
VIQAREVGKQPVLGLVTRTNYVTSKGALVRDVLYPNENVFNFYKDAMIFVFGMAFVGIIGFCTTIPVLLKEGAETA